MCVVCILISPIARDHYMVILLLPAAQIAWNLRLHQYPRIYTCAAAVAAFLLMIPHYRWISLAKILGGSANMAFMPAFVTVLLPVTALIVFAYLAARTRDATAK